MAKKYYLVLILREAIGKDPDETCEAECERNAPTHTTTFLCKKEIEIWQERE